MKVLLINDFLIKGGTEVQGLREKKILEDHGHNVMLLTFDCDFPENDNYFNLENGFINIKLKENFIFRILSRVFINIKVKKKIERIINSYNPDIIHLNNIYNYTITKYNVVSKYKNIQTIRDYAAVCPLATCIKLDGSVCRGMNYNNCYSECGKSFGNIMKIFINTKNNKIRKKYINKFICPSEKLTEYCKEHNYNVECINNPFDFEKIKILDKNIDFNNKKYLYYGAINEEKGIMPFIDAFIDFSKDKSVELVIAGKVKDSIRKDFFNKINNINKIKYKGFLKYDDMMEELRNVYTVVVPSKWMENYPNTVLEGHATETLVIGSNRGGIPNMLSDGKGFIFDIDNKDSIVDCLEKTYKLSNQEYFDIVYKAKKFVIQNNSFDKYYFNIIKAFN